MCIVHLYMWVFQHGAAKIRVKIRVKIHVKIRVNIRVKICVKLVVGGNIGVKRGLEGVGGLKNPLGTHRIDF